MKNVYVFCSFAVLMLGLMISAYLLHTQISGLEQELSDMEQQLSQQNLYMEMIGNKPDHGDDQLSAATEQTETEQDTVRDAAASAQHQEQTEHVQESGQEQRHLTGYDIRLAGSVLYVYTAGEEEPMITLPVSEGYLTETQRSLLEQGLHIEDMQEVYHLLESYSS